MWVFKASTSKCVRDAFAVFEQAIVDCDETAEVWAEYVRFVLYRANVTKQPKYVQKALELMSRAGDHLPKELVLERVRLTRDIELARLATTKFYDDLEAWTIRLLLECSVRNETDGHSKLNCILVGDNGHALSIIFRRAIRNISLMTLDGHIQASPC